MLTYKLKENCIDPTTKTPIKDYLISLGIAEKDIDSFIGIPKIDDEISPFKLRNMDIAVMFLANRIYQKMFLIVDCDVDGFTSSAIFYRYFKNRYPELNITYMLHEGKEHGIELDKIPQDAELIIIPDAGSMQKEEQQALLDAGKSILILDHHEVTGEVINSEELVIVNNQISEEFENKALSGAGVTFKFIQAYEEFNPLTPDEMANGKKEVLSASYYYDLAALGIISDGMDMRTLDNNYIVWKGLRKINNKMFKALIDKQTYKLEGTVTKYGIAFYIAPVINGVIRAGTMDEKLHLFLGFIEEPDQESYDRVFRGNSYHENYYEYVARIAVNIKGRQDTEKKKCFNFLCERIEQEHLNNNKVLVIVTSKDDRVAVPQTITGLIAMDLQKQYNKPVLVLRPKIENGKLSYAGSARCKKYEGLNSFLQFVRDSKFTEYGEGHAMAFGASIPADHLDDFIKESNERLADIDYGSDYVEVDAIFNQSNINYLMLGSFGKYKNIYGTNIPQPLIAIEATIDSGNITLMGSDASTVKIMIDKLPCIKFKDKDLAEELNGGSYKVKIVGRPNLNIWNGTETPQLFIDQIEIEPIKKMKLF